jgi:hypothetical protein
MSDDTLGYLEKVLSGLKSRYVAGDKSVEVKLRAVSLKVEQLKLKKETASTKPKKSLGRRMSQAIRRRGCCR